jgi:hypothetical protein
MSTALLQRKSYPKPGLENCLSGSGGAAHVDEGRSDNGTHEGVVTLSAISLISAIEQQAKSLKSHASAFAAIGQFRSI